MQVSGVSMVLELDVPVPLPYLTIPTPEGGVRVPFYAVQFERPGPDEAYLALVNAHFSIMEQIEQLISDGILWWACRPIVEETASGWRALMRVGTTPELPQSFWQKLSAVAA